MTYSKSVLLVAVLLIGRCSCQAKYDDDSYKNEQLQQQQQQEEEGSAGNGVDASVPEPPSQIPETSFVCEGKPYDPGMYADEETGCRVYHMCFRGRKEDFICGTGTVFNQEALTCDYQANVDCGASSQFYDSNSEFGKGAPEPSGDEGAKPAARAPRPQAPRPQAPRPGYTPQPQVATRQPPSKSNPRPVVRPPPAQPRPQAPRPKTNPRPQVQPRPRPTQRPVVQQDQQEEQSLDYEPSNVQFQRRSGLAPSARSRTAARSVPAPSPVNGRRGQASFRPMSQRWQMMSANYGPN